LYQEFLWKKKTRIKDKTSFNGKESEKKWPWKHSEKIWGSDKAKYSEKKEILQKRVNLHMNVYF